jgi:hypothetical protein
METKEETPLIRGGSVKKPDSPEKPGMFFWWVWSRGRDTELIDDIALFVVLREWYVKLNKIAANINALTVFIVGRVAQTV